MCKILDYAAEKGKAEYTKQTIMKMFEQNYTKKQILDIFDEISGRQYKKYLKEYKKNRRQPKQIFFSTYCLSIYVVMF